MSLTIVLSGPKVSTSQACTALVAAGINVQATERDHGLPPCADGEDIREAQSFITAEGDDIDRAHQVVSSLGWGLRMHYPTPEPVPPSAEAVLAQELAELKAEVAALKARMA